MEGFTGKILLKAIVIAVMMALPGMAIHAQTDAPPTVQDCLGAIPVCQPVYSTVNSYTGYGNVYPEIRNNSLCPLCMDGEKNDVFYIITVQTSGLLRFTLTPNNPSNDYDWSMFNMTSSSCDRLYLDALELQVSCNSYGVMGTTGPTGINTSLGNSLNCNGPGTVGVKFNKDLTVFAGQTYLLNVSNWSATNQSGYTLDFSGSTASIFDVTPAVIENIQHTVSCAGSDTLSIRFSENIKCTDVFHHPEKFTLTGPGGTYVITDVTSPECATGAPNGRRCMLHVSPALGPGSHTLTISGDIRDLCDNICVYNNYPFTLTEINAPTVSAGNDTTVANGAIVTLHGSVAGGEPPYTFQWEPAAMLVNPALMQPVTINMGATVNFVMNVTDNAGCHGTSDVLVTVVGGPLGVNATAEPGTVCPGVAVQLNALVSGGSGNYSYSWSSNPPGFTSNLPSPTVYPTAGTTYTVQVGDGFSNISGTVAVQVNPRPVAGAGANTTIPYGTSVTLQGSATGGSGNYSWSWTSVPPGYASSGQSPTFSNLAATTIFSLVATDQASGCISDPAHITVTVTGSPLACNPVALPQVICRKTSTTLNAMAGGGAGNYTCQWTSIPPGFSSQETNPVVTPDETTTYLLTVSDGFNTASGAVSVTVKPLPEFPGWPADTTACIYEIVRLDAGNPGSLYYWSNGATTQAIDVETTGIGFDQQYYRVRVLNAEGCTDSVDARVTFSFSACTAIDETLPDGGLSVWPNPGGDMLNLEAQCPGRLLRLEVTDIVGQNVLSDRIPCDAGSRISRVYDLGRFAKGLYLVRVSDGNFTRTVKFVRR